MWLWFCTSWSSVLFPNVNELQISTMEQYCSCSLTLKLFILPSVLIYISGNEVIFLKSLDLTLLTWQCVNSSRWVHFCSTDISLIYECMSLLIETPRSQWLCMLSIADDVSLTGSLISVPDGKAVPWRGSCVQTKMTYQLFSTTSLFIFLHRRNMGGVHLVFFLYICQNPFKEWSNPPFDVSLEAIM